MKANSVKSKVDPLIKLLDFRQGEASRALSAAQQQLATLHADRVGLLDELQAGESRFDALQGAPTNPEDHALHRAWLKELKARIERKQQEIQAQEEEVETCRNALSAIHLELRTLERYKEQQAERVKLEHKALEAKELDEIAGQKHRRQEA